MVTREDILKIAKLAKLSVDESQIDKLTEDMSNIIGFADTINNAVDDGDIEFVEINTSVNSFRSDVVIVSYDREDILRNRDGGEKGMFVVDSRSTK